MKNLESLIKTYNDFPQKGIAFKDILGIIQDPKVFRELILKMSSNKVIKSSEAIISIEARGFLFIRRQNYTKHRKLANSYKH